MSDGQLPSLIHKKGKQQYKLSSSFDGARGRWLDGIYETPEESPWYVASPMTHHVIREHKSPPREQIRRTRSRSFNDYIDSRDEYARPNFDSANGILLIPPLKQGGRLPALPVDKIASSKQDTSADDAFDVSEEPSETVKEKAKDEKGNPIWICVMYGMINATIVLPVLMSFGSIIYRNDAFQPYMPVLIKLTVVSGVVHQICFSTLSSLPFAIGQVQDAGLIFLSSMAKDMVNYCKDNGYDDEVLLATVTIGLGTCTAILGLGLVVIGKLRLAGYVQLLPTCVVGGYLAFIGWFCGMSGIGIMAGANDLSLSVLSEKSIFIIPGVIGGIVIYSNVRVFRHVAVLPMCIILLLMSFYLGLAVKGTSIQQATENGWIRQSEPAPVWYHTWDYLKFNKVVWSALPQLILTETSMIFVVALSSSLDVAAIELEMNRPLNYNGELSMVGVSNIISGLTGGYTGSYIFSQSIFSLRAGIRSRLAGYVLALCQIVVIVTPLPILAYVPNFFYGSLLSMICIDLLYEWLWDVRNKITISEYVICLATFGLIQIIGVEYGIIAGVIIYVVCRKVGLDVGEIKMVTTESEVMAPEGEEIVEMLEEHDHSQYGAIDYSTGLSV